MRKRKVDIAVISDVHLGSNECHVDELIAYLSSIKPDKLILNGDIVDICHFEKHCFPPSHSKVLRKIKKMASNGTEVILITANRDAGLRETWGAAFENFRVCRNLVLELHGRKAWFLHGDVLDNTIPYTRWLTRLGSYGYNALFFLNGAVNWFLGVFDRGKYSSAKRKKTTEKHLDDFQKNASNMAISSGYDYVVCGHVHKPIKKYYENKNGKCIYLNSGDWIENLTALEYSFKRWKLYQYNYDKLLPFFAVEELKSLDMNELVACITEAKPATKPSKEGQGESIRD